MSDETVNADRLLELSGMVLSGSASENDRVELNGILLADEASRRCYLDYCRMHVALRVELRARHAVQTAYRQIDIGAIGSPSDGAGPVKADAPDVPVFHAPLHSTFSYLSSGWPAAYLIATVIFGIGAFIGTFTYVSHYEGTAGGPMPAVAVSGVEGQTQSEPVGRITGLVGCKYLGCETPTNPASVAVGREFVLTSGLMEITYLTGAKVILQGPVTYRVDSFNSGVLSVGKLTGVVDAKTAVGFLVRTPTATITDLGTEFGVDVDKSGATRAHVFRGSVRLDPVGAESGDQGRRVLRGNESAEVVKVGDHGMAVIRRIALNSEEFVRPSQFLQLAENGKYDPFQQWQAYSNGLRNDPSLLAYYDFQLAAGQPSVLRNVASNADRSRDGTVLQANWTDGRFAGKHAILFQDQNDYARLKLPQTVDDLSLAAWVSVRPATEGPLTLGGLLMSESLDHSGQMHWKIDSNGCIHFVQFGIKHNTDSRTWMSRSVRTQLQKQPWNHLAVTVDRSARARFYVNGELVDDIAAGDREQIPFCIGAARIGVWKFNGRIDEMAVFGRVLTPEEIAAMYRRGNPMNKMSSVKSSGKHSEKK